VLLSTPAHLLRELDRPPAVIGWLKNAVFCHFLWSALILTLVAATLTEAAPDPVEPAAILMCRLWFSPEGPLRSYLVVATTLWTLGAFAVVLPALARRKRWAWSAAEGLLFVKSASLTAGLASLLLLAFRLGAAAPQARADIAMYCGLCAAVAASALQLTAALFRARGWFGIEARRGWRTMLQEGWWALLPTLVLEVAYLITLGRS
jgi:hypothetical protein